MKCLIYQYFHQIKQRAEKKKPPYWQLSQNSINAYARKYRHDYLFLSHKVKPSFWYGSFELFLNKTYQSILDNYDLICYIDTDVLATIDAPDIFQAVGRQHISANYLKCYHQVNAGIVVFPQSEYQNLRDWLSKNLEIIHWRNSWPMGPFDQQVLNLYLHQGQFARLPKQFNWMPHIYGEENRLTGRNLIHYLAQYKNTLMEKDYEHDRILKA